MLHSKIWASVQFGKLSNGAKLLYIGTITLADDHGKLHGNPWYLKGQILPYDEEIKAPMIEGFLKEIEKVGLIARYRDGITEYIKHPNWEKYQSLRKDRMKPSEIPDANQMSTKRQPDDNQARAEDKISKGKVSKDNTLLRRVGAQGSPSGNPEVNETIAYTMKTLELGSLDGSKEINRRYAWLLIKKFKEVKKIKELVDAAADDRFHASNCTSMKYLYYNAEKIMRSHGS